MKDMNPFERVCFGCETVVDGGEPTLKCAGACGWMADARRRCCRERPSRR